MDVTSDIVGHLWDEALFVKMCMSVCTLGLYNMLKATFSVGQTGIIHSRLV